MASPAPTSPPAPQARPIVSVVDVEKRFGGLWAIEGCSLEIESGSITGLIGPNGAGKTTLFNIISGFLKPDRGEIFLNGQNVTAYTPHQLFRLGLVRTFQIPQEFTRLTVLDNLMLVPRAHAGENLLRVWFQWGRVSREEAEIRRRAEEVLEFLKLHRLRDEFAGELSGGQKKLLELGRAMMTDARVILLDEPGAGVNPTLLAELSGFIRRLNEERGLTFCIVEHDMDLIAELCHPVVVMAEGTVLTQGSMAEVRADPRVLEAYFGGAGAGAGEAS